MLYRSRAARAGAQARECALAAIGVLARVGHGQDARTIVLQAEVLILRNTHGPASPTRAGLQLPHMEGNL